MDNRFNHDCFNTWKTCQKKFYLKYVKNYRLPEFFNDFELGKSVHALIDYKLRGLKIEHLLKDAPQNVLNCWNSIKNHPVFEKKLVTSEWAFNVAFENLDAVLLGRIDAVFYDEENSKYIIADWKTGKHGTKKINDSFQHEIYLYAFYLSQKDLGLNFLPEDLYFQYFKIFPDYVDDTEKIFFSQEKFVEYEKKFINIINMMQTFENPASPEVCPSKFCEYKKICGIC